MTEASSIDPESGPPHGPPRPPGGSAPARDVGILVPPKVRSFPIQVSVSRDAVVVSVPRSGQEARLGGETVGDDGGHGMFPVKVLHNTPVADVLAKVADSLRLWDGMSGDDAKDFEHRIGDLLLPPGLRERFIEQVGREGMPSCASRSRR